MARGWHGVRDPLLNFIVLNDLERQVTDTPEFQRLRRIKQLATTHFVYPGAMHTRFEHALGTLELATRAFDTLLAKGGSKFLSDLGWKSESEAARAKQILRLGALLHDIGHPPFSHAPEAKLLKNGLKHEDYTMRIIGEANVGDVIRGSQLYNLPIDDIIYIAVGPKSKIIPNDVATRFLGEIVFGDLGVDRIDYLNRDSLHLGVQYGRFDYARLLNTLTYSTAMQEGKQEAPEQDQPGDPVLAIEEGGIHAAEGLLLARYFMFTQVYSHDVRVAYDLHLEAFMRRFLMLRYGEPWLPLDTEAYLKLSDVDIEEAMMTCTDTDLLALAAPFHDRKSHFRLAFELYPSDQESQPGIADSLRAKVDKQFPKSVVWAEPSKETHSLRSGDMLVVGDRTEDIMVRSELLQRLPSSIWRGRFYCDAASEKDVREFCKAEMNAGEEPREE